MNITPAELRELLNSAPASGGVLTGEELIAALGRFLEERAPHYPDEALAVLRVISGLVAGAFGGPQETTEPAPDPPPSRPPVEPTARTFGSPTLSPVSARPGAPQSPDVPEASTVSALFAEGVEGDDVEVFLPPAS